MQCLRCPNEALPGKALCASCFAAHQKKVEFEETDDWVKQQLEATRSQSRERDRESKGPETSAQGLVLRLAPALLAMGGLVMVFVYVMNNISFTFTPTPESEQAEGAPVGAAAKKQADLNKSPLKGPAPAAQKPISAPVAAAKAPETDDRAWEEPAAPPEPTPVPTTTPTSTPTATPTTTPEGRA
jgi:cytoskeletal protein RodZ